MLHIDWVRLFVPFLTFCFNGIHLILLSASKENCVWHFPIQMSLGPLFTLPKKAEYKKIVGADCKRCISSEDILSFSPIFKHQRCICAIVIRFFSSHCHHSNQDRFHTQKKKKWRKMCSFHIIIQKDHCISNWYDELTRIIFKIFY